MNSIGIRTPFGIEFRRNTAKSRNDICVSETERGAAELPSDFRAARRYPVLGHTDWDSIRD